MLILKTWLQYLTDLDFFGLFMKIIRSIFLALDGIIYAIISYCYEVFTFISEIRVFENEDMVNLANRIYILIGVVSLFLVAYTLLNAIINPENATKDKNKSFAGIVKNIILAIIGIAIVPTIFDYAYEFQSRVLCNNVIQKFFLENNITEDDDARAKMGAQMSLYLFKSFYYIKGSEDDTSLDENANSNWETMAQSIVSDSDDSYNLSMAFSDIELGNRSISEALGDFDDSIDSGKLGYLFLISTLAGAYCAYVLLNFVIDMGVRAVKLAYLQLIAPLPILTIILPNQKKVFDNWLKKTSSCFIEVFTRIIAMSFAFYAIKYLRPWIFNDMSSVSCGRTVGAVTKLLAEAAFIIGVFTFLKQLPKFLKDLLPGFDSSGFKLGIADKLGEMALIGGAAKSGFQRAEGAATGALGGLATGLANRKKVDWKSAVMQGATQGFKDKGNQFSKQRKATFQSIGEYKDKTQGLFGGESKVSKFINDHKKDVENDYGEKANIKKHNGMSSRRYSEIKDGFSEDKINDRIDSFKKSQEYKAAEAYAAERMKATGETSEAVKESEISNYLNNLKANTTDKDLKRRISQYESDNTVLEQIGDLQKCKSEVSSATNNYSKAQQKYSNAQRMISDNDDKIAQAQSVLPSKNDALEAANAELSSKQQDIDAAIQRANAEKSKLDAAVASIIKIHPELKDGFDKANDYDEIKKLLGDFKLKLDEQDRAAGGAILNNGRTELNQAMSAIREYDNITVQKESIQKDYDIALQSQKIVQEEYDSYVKVIDDLQRENETLLGQSREAQEEIQKFRKAIKDAKDSYEKSQAEFVKKVNDAAELVYNGDASINKNGTDDLDILASALNSAIENNDKQLADALYEQIKIMENYRGAKQGITDMNKEINYEKELYNYFKKQKKDE